MKKTWYISFSLGVAAFLIGLSLLHDEGDDPPPAAKLSVTDRSAHSQSVRLRNRSHEEVIASNQNLPDDVVSLIALERNKVDEHMSQRVKIMARIEEAREQEDMDLFKALMVQMRSENEAHVRQLQEIRQAKRGGESMEEIFDAPDARLDSLHRNRERN